MPSAMPAQTRPISTVSANRNRNTIRAIRPSAMNSRGLPSARDVQCRPSLTALEIPEKKPEGLRMILAFFVGQAEGEGDSRASVRKAGSWVMTASTGASACAQASAATARVNRCAAAPV